MCILLLQVHNPLSATLKSKKYCKLKDVFKNLFIFKFAANSFGNKTWPEWTQGYLQSLFI